jgi:hypothetical protein
MTMGNLRWSAEAVDVINPSAHPYLHVETSFGKPRYVPSAADGLDVYLGALKHEKISLFGDKRTRFMQLGEKPFHVPILPPIDTLPPSPIETESRIEIVVGELFSGTDFQTNLEMDRKVTVVMVSCGRFWGHKPVNAVAERLNRLGYKVNDTSMQLGRGHRFQDYSIVLDR